jgi:hypothetical protein
MVKYYWKCPYQNCLGHGEPNHRTKAKRIGKTHLQRKHKDFISEPILLKDGE